MAWWDIGLQFTVEFKSENVAEHTWPVRAGNWSELEKKWYKVKSQRKINEVYGFNTALSNAMIRIADRVKDHMYHYAPVDESKYKDDVVLRENIDYEWQWDRVVIWTDDIPYATRRNYENKLHPNKRHYIEKSFNNHYDEYERILEDEIWNVASDIWDNMLKELRKSSWAWMPHRYF